MSTFLILLDLRLVWIDMGATDSPLAIVIALALHANVAGSNPNNDFRISVADITFSVVKQRTSFQIDHRFLKMVVFLRPPHLRVASSPCLLHTRLGVLRFLSYSLQFCFE